MPSGSAELVASHPARLRFIGSLTSRSDVAPPPEAEAVDKDLALLAFGTHAEMECPVDEQQMSE